MVPHEGPFSLDDDSQWSGRNSTDYCRPLRCPEHAGGPATFARSLSHRGVPDVAGGTRHYVNWIAFLVGQLHVAEPTSGGESPEVSEPYALNRIGDLREPKTAIG